MHGASWEVRHRVSAAMPRLPTLVAFTCSACEHPQYLGCWQTGPNDVMFSIVASRLEPSEHSEWPSTGPQHRIQRSRVVICVHRCSAGLPINKGRERERDWSLGELHFLCSPNGKSNLQFERRISCGAFWEGGSSARECRPPPPPCGNGMEGFECAGGCTV